MNSGMPSDIIIADNFLGAFRLLPESYTITHISNGFNRMEIEGIIGDVFDVDRTNMLRGLSLLELMGEVSRRIKMGENKKENMQKTTSGSMGRRPSKNG